MVASYSLILYTFPFVGAFMLLNIIFNALHKNHSKLAWIYFILISPIWVGGALATLAWIVGTLLITAYYALPVLYLCYLTFIYGVCYVIEFFGQLLFG